MSRDFDFDPDGVRLPIKIDRATNGEYAPTALTPAQRAANAQAHEAADANAKRLGLGRRDFLISASGAAATLLAFNDAHARAGARGGYFDLPQEAGLDQDAAMETLTSDDFIFDVQTHCVDPAGDWASGADGERWARNLTEVFGGGGKDFEDFSAEVLAKEVFLDSDTDAGVVSALWGREGENPTPIEYAAEAAAVAEAVGDGTRCLIHGGVLPNEAGEVESMEAKARQYGAVAWKMYPQWGPDGVGIFLDESEDAARMFEEARRLNVRTIAVHKGVPLPGLEYDYSSPKDMGRAAAANPDITFLTYHSGFESGVPEGAYDPENAKGVDRLIKAHDEAGLKPNEGNLYAEMGSLWRYFMSRPEEAAHVMGKLLVHFGEDRIMWGTDSIWYGSPQDQIQAFRAFQISEEFQERYGYPAITPEMKRKIFGLNGARVYGLDADALQKTDAGSLRRRRAEYRENANPSFATYGPKTRREFFAAWKASGGRPG